MKAMLKKLAPMPVVLSLVLFPFAARVSAIGLFDALDVIITPAKVEFTFANAAGSDGYIGFSNIFCADTNTIVAHAATDDFTVNYATGNKVSYVPVEYDTAPHTNCFLRIYSNAGHNDYQSVQRFAMNMNSPSWLERVSINASKQAAGVIQGTADAHTISLNGDGRLAAFYSANTDGVLDGQQGVVGLYLRDRHLGTTTLMSVGNSGQQANRVFGDRDQDISYDAGHVMFMSSSDNLDPLATDGQPHCYVRATAAGVTELASITPSGAVSATRFCAMSDDGNVVAFMPLAQTSNVYVRNLQTQITTQLPYTIPLTPLSLSMDGRYLAFDDGTNALVYDNMTGTTTVASVNMTGASNGGFINNHVDSISLDGRYVFFQSAQKLTSDAPNSCSPFCLYRRDTVSGVTQFGHSGQAGVFSRDGNINVYTAGAGDVYKHDFAANTTQLIVPFETWEGTPSGVSALEDHGTQMGIFTSAFGFTEAQAYVGSTDQHPLPQSDTVAPTISQPSWSTNPMQQGQSTTLSVTASDNSGTVTQVTYSIEGGQPQPMTLNSGVWQATFGSGLAANSYNVDIVATDPAGNSATTNDVLAVYNPTNGYVTGHAKLAPTASDTMPIALDTSNNPAELIAGFTNVTSPASGSFDINYIVKNNKDEFTLSSTLINWIVVSDNTHASILGRANLSVYINSNHTVTQNVSVRFDIALGTNGAPDHLTIKIFSPNDNPSIAPPLYVISDNVIANGSNLMIHQ